jgi:hypothetical protein
MRLAWFRPPSPPAATPARQGPGDTSLLVRALRGRHEIELIDEHTAHDFVWQHARNPFDLCVYELDGTPAHQFVAAYAVHYPGVVLMRGLPRHDRAIRAARLVVVPQEPVAQALSDDFPDARVRTLAPGVEPLPDDAGAVIEALRWPPDAAALSYAMAGFAASRAVIVFDGLETADWPSLDPQNWQPRAPLEQRRPICVSVDPRDEAHSLRLARRRLDADAQLRTSLGNAAHEWWRAHATVRIAATGFDAILQEAATLPAPPAAAHADDGTGKAREILSRFAPGLWELT